MGKQCNIPAGLRRAVGLRVVESFYGRVTSSGSNNFSEDYRDAVVVLLPKVIKNKWATEGCFYSPSKRKYLHESFLVDWFKYPRKHSLKYNVGNPALSWNRRRNIRNQTSSGKCREQYMNLYMVFIDFSEVCDTWTESPYGLSLGVLISALIRTHQGGLLIPQTVLGGVEW